MEEVVEVEDAVREEDVLVWCFFVKLIGYVDCAQGAESAIKWLMRPSNGVWRQ